MLKVAVLLNTFFTVVVCCNTFDDVQVDAILKPGVPFRTKITGCIERTAFYEGNITRYVWEIDIHDQDVQRLRKDTVRNMAQLRKLTIRNTNLHTMDARLFRNVPSLESVAFINNKLKEVPKGAFNSSTINWISLSNNRIDFIEDQAFSDVENLNYLNLSYNKLNAISRNWFAELHKLNTLDFQHNKIRNVPRKAFTYAKNLTSIFLNYNDIEDILVNAFEGLSGLKYLGLKHNLLKNINEKMFPPNFSIEVLCVDANRLNFIKETFVQSVKVGTISLDGNPWNCHCYRKIIREFAAKGTKIETSTECVNLNIPVCVVSSDSEPISNCVERINQELTRYYYKQVEYLRKSDCIRYLEVV